MRKPRSLSMTSFSFFVIGFFAGVTALLSKIGVSGLNSFPESYTRMRVDCLHDRQSMQQSIVHAGCLAQKLLRNFAAVLGQLCHHFFVQPHVHSG